MPERSPDSPADPSGPMPVIAPERPGDFIFTESDAAQKVFDVVESHVKPGDLKALPKKRLGIGFWLAIVWIAAIVIGALFAGWIPFIKSPNQEYFDQLRGGAAGPSLEHWFGVDSKGHDLFAVVMYGARISLAVAFASVFFGLLLGGFFGVVAGYFKRKIEWVIVAGMDVILSFPALVLALTVVSFGGRTLPNVIIALTIVAIPAIARITRANTLVFANREFVLAARTLGAKPSRVIVREILPNVIPPMLSFALIGIAIVIVAEGALAFVGFSVQAQSDSWLRADSWGQIINFGRLEMSKGIYHIALIPAAVMFLTILSFNHLGEVARRYLDVKESTL